MLMVVFDRLSAYFGPLYWWPAETPFEVCVGAILTQNTAWTNVEKAIIELKKADLLTAERIRDTEDQHLAMLIRSSGFYNVKSRRLKEFVGWLCNRFDGSLDQMFKSDWLALRSELVSVRGIGPETCDSILLYAGEKPSFVVDSYTRRLCHRLGILEENASYDEIRLHFMQNLPNETLLFNEYHALIVEQCKRFCRSKPICAGCPLLMICKYIKLDRNNK